MNLLGSLPEFLDDLVLRGQCWCVVSLAGRTGFGVGSNDAILLYAVLEGSVTLSVVPDHKVLLNTGDIAFVLDRRPHALRTEANCAVEELPFLNSAQYVDTPATFSLGNGETEAKILCGRLKVRWPRNIRPADLPAIIEVPEATNIVRFDALARNSRGKGATGALTHAASLILVAALTLQPEIHLLFKEKGSRSPISRAIKLMEEKPAEPWTLQALANQVGMGRTVFATHFLAETGRPPFEILMEVRMELARKLLLQSDLKISEVGERVGYYSESAFHRRFTLYFNVPPGKMRSDRGKWKAKRSALLKEYEMFLDNRATNSGRHDIFAPEMPWLEGSQSGILYARFQLNVMKSDSPSVILTKFPPGARIEAHTHDTNSFEYILEGEQVVEETIFREGDVRIIKAGTAYGPVIVGADGCTLLLVFEDGSRSMFERPPRRKPISAAHARLDDQTGTDPRNLSIK